MLGGVALGAGKQYADTVADVAKSTVLNGATFGGYGIASFWAAAIEEGQKGYEYDGVRGAGISVINRFNPLNHIGVGVAGTIEAVNDGDWETAGREGFKVGVTIGTVIAGAVTGGVKAMERGGGAGEKGFASATTQGSKRTFSPTDRAKAFDKARDVEGVPRCEYCGKELTPGKGSATSYEADHRIPFARGGPTTPENLAPSCRSCNRSKGAKTVEEWER